MSKEKIFISIYKAVMAQFGLTYYVNLDIKRKYKSTFFLEAHLLPLLPPGYLRHSAHTPGSFSMSYTKTLFQIIPTSLFMAQLGCILLTYSYKLNILLTYSNVLFLTISTIVCEVALLPVSVTTSCPRTPRSLCSTLSAPKNPAIHLPL